MRFHPKRRASTDQAPGPSNARAAPRVPSMILVHGSPGCEKAFHSAMTATNAPAMGVHNPANRSIPEPVASTSRIAGAIVGSPRNVVSPRTTNAIPATSLMSSRPTPGEPWANVENSRRTRKSKL
jgi:hypothetical protein